MHSRWRYYTRIEFWRREFRRWCRWSRLLMRLLNLCVFLLLKCWILLFKFTVAIDGLHHYWQSCFTINQFSTSYDMIFKLSYDFVFCDFRRNHFRAKVRISDEMWSKITVNFSKLFVFSLCCCYIFTTNKLEYFTPDCNWICDQWNIWK